MHINRWFAVAQPGLCSTGLVPQLAHRSPRCPAQALELLLTLHINSSDNGWFAAWLAAGPLVSRSVGWLFEGDRAELALAVHGSNTCLLLVCESHAKAAFVDHAKPDQTNDTTCQCAWTLINATARASIWFNAHACKYSRTGSHGKQLCGRCMLCVPTSTPTCSCVAPACVSRAASAASVRVGCAPLVRCSCSSKSCACAKARGQAMRRGCTYLSFRLYGTIVPSFLPQTQKLGLPFLGL